jgi:hypothetical protein
MFLRFFAAGPSSPALFSAAARFFATGLSSPAIRSAAARFFILCVRFIMTKSFSIYDFR